MREVSSCFQFVSADLPASKPSRNPSSVSPSGVLMDMPVMTIRRVIGLACWVLLVDKVDLHDGEAGDLVASHELARADRRVVVAFHDLGEDVERIPRTDGG